MNNPGVSTKTVKKLIWTALFTVYAGIILYGSVYPVSTEATSLVFPGADKVIHAGEFFLFTLIGTRTISYYSARNDSQRSLLVVATFYGGLTELVQLFFPYRTASILDWLANLFGIVTGLMVIFMVKKWKERNDYS